MEAALSSRRPVGFLDTPLEIRRQIYQYCLVRKDLVNFHHIYIDEYSFSERRVRDRKKSRLFVLKKVGLEALEVLYGDKVFQLYRHGRGGSDLSDCSQKPTYVEYGRCRS